MERDGDHDLLGDLLGELLHLKYNALGNLTGEGIGDGNLLLTGEGLGDGNLLLLVDWSLLLLEAMMITLALGCGWTEFWSGTGLRLDTLLIPLLTSFSTFNPLAWDVTCLSGLERFEIRTGQIKD